MKSLQKQIKVNIEGAEYIVKFPNVGQFLDIENTKMMLTNNNYADMVRSNLKSNYLAIDIVDVISIFSVLIPELSKDLSVRTYTELDPFLAKKLIKVYKKQFQPWYDSLMKELMKEEDNEIKEEEKVEDEVGTINLG